MIIPNTNYGLSGLAESDFSYTGTYKFARDGRNWEIALLSSGTLKFLKNVGLVDFFVVSGGKDGDSISSWGSAGNLKACSGGKGGGRVTSEGVLMTKGADYAAVIGANEQNSSISGTGVSLSAAPGTGTFSFGGGGAESDRDAVDPDHTLPQYPMHGAYAYEKATDTVLISDFVGHKFGAGGGGGGCDQRLDGHTRSGGMGGDTGGGRGGGYDEEETMHNGADGLANHGAGGGGAYRFRSGTDNYCGHGGSGIIFIRNHREGIL
jgi:hypothetical protein